VGFFGIGGFKLKYPRIMLLKKSLSDWTGYWILVYILGIKGEYDSFILICNYNFTGVF
jgi:hypothetical protein